jgi:hypothetical protein
MCSRLLLGEVQKPKQSTQVLPNTYQRRLLPRTDVQHKLHLNQSQPAKVKPTAKGDSGDEVDGNEINRLTEVTYSLDDVENDWHRPKGEFKKNILFSVCGWGCVLL